MIHTIRFFDIRMATWVTTRLLCICAVILPAPNIIFAQTISFGAATSIELGDWASSVAIGDLDGDGAFDLVVANESSGLATLMGLGDGTFDPATSAEAYLAFVTTGDLDGDGILDLAAIGRVAGQGRVRVFLGDGAGSFGPAADYDAGDGAQEIAIGELNGDGIPDLAVAHFGHPPNPDGTVTILNGVGDGTFGSATQVAAGLLTPYSIAIEDLNGDGRRDLAVAHSGPHGKVAVLMGLGDGTFGATTDYDTGPGPTSVAVGDLDKDGALDLVTANSSYVSGRTDHVSVLLGRGDGTFEAAMHFAGPTPLAATSWAVALGDLNLDGRLDLATANTGHLDQFSVLQGRGDGTFDAALNIDVSSAGIGVSDVAMKDLNGDGKLDLVTADGGNNTVSILLNTTILDSDGDGIRDGIDVDATTYSDEFDNDNTEGSIIDRGDQTLTVTPSNGGVLIEASSEGGSEPATVSACDGKVELTLTAGTSATVTCGSVVVAAHTGDIQVTFLVNGWPQARLTLPAGHQVTFDDASLDLTADTDNTSTLTIETERAELTIAPGVTVGIVKCSFSILIFVVMIVLVFMVIYVIVRRRQALAR